MIYRRLLGLAMVGIGLAVLIGGSATVEFFMATWHLESSADAFGVGLALCGIILAVEPESKLFPLLSLPFLLYLANIVYYTLTYSRTGLAGLVTNIALYAMATAEIFARRAQRRAPQ